MTRVDRGSARPSTAGFIKQLERTDLGNLNDMPDDELMQAGDGTGELGAWVAVAASMRGRPSYEWIDGMAS